VEVEIGIGCSTAVELPLIEVGSGPVARFGKAYRLKLQPPPQISVPSSVHGLLHLPSSVGSPVPLPGFKFHCRRST